MERDESKTNIKIIVALTLVHFTGDFYSAFLMPLIPLLTEKFALTLTQVGLITGISRFLAFIVQPSVGYIADHYRSRLFILGGPLLVMVFMSLVGVAPSYYLLILFIAISSIGSSMFHPTVAGMISTYAGRNRGFCMSVFNMGGTMAFGAGPLFIAFFVGAYGLEASPYTVLIGLVVLVYLWLSVPRPDGEGLGKLGFIGSIKEVFGDVWKPILIIWVVMVSRSFVGQSFMTFIPVYFAHKGHSILSLGAIASCFTVAGAMSGLLAGRMADRLGYKPIFLIAHSLATPCLYLMLYTSGNGLYFMTFLTGFFILATMPLGVAMAQDLAPKGKSMASSLMMGFAFGTGGMMAPITGRLADMFSIREVLSVLAVIPLLSVGLILFLPNRVDNKQ